MLEPSTHKYGYFNLKNRYYIEGNKLKIVMCLNLKQLEEGQGTV